jgi:hypothetical protein
MARSARQQFDTLTRMRRSIVAVLCVALLVTAGCSKSAPKPRSGLKVGTSVGDNDLAKLVLTEDDVRAAGGEPVTVSVGPGSEALTGAQGTTLDQCASSYKSEALRTSRYQVGYLNPAGLLSASNELVHYKKGGAAASYDELTAAVKHCTPSTGTSGFRLDPSNSRLLAQQVAFSVKVTQPQGPTVYQVSIYQYRGDVLDVVYVFRPQRDQARAIADRLAERARAILESA